MSAIIYALSYTAVFVGSFIATIWLFTRDWRTKEQKQRDYQKAVDRRQEFEMALRETLKKFEEAWKL